MWRASLGRGGGCSDNHRGVDTVGFDSVFPLCNAFLPHGPASPCLVDANAPTGRETQGLRIQLRRASNI